MDEAPAASSDEVGPLQMARNAGWIESSLSSFVFAVLLGLTCTYCPGIVYDANVSNGTETSIVMDLPLGQASVMDVIEAGLQMGSGPHPMYNGAMAEECRRWWSRYWY